MENNNLEWKLGSYELRSKLLVSPFIGPIMLAYMPNQYKPPFKEFRFHLRVGLKARCQGHPLRARIIMGDLTTPLPTPSLQGLGFRVLLNEAGLGANKNYVRL